MELIAQGSSPFPYIRKYTLGSRYINKPTFVGTDHFPYTSIVESDIMAAPVLSPISVSLQTLKREQDAFVTERTNASYAETNKSFSLNGHLSPVNCLFLNLSFSTM